MSHNGCSVDGTVGAGSVHHPVPFTGTHECTRGSKDGVGIPSAYLPASGWDLKSGRVYFQTLLLYKTRIGMGILFSEMPMLFSSCVTRQVSHEIIINK